MGVINFTGFELGETRQEGVSFSPLGIFVAAPIARTGQYALRCHANTANEIGIVDPPRSDGKAPGLDWTATGDDVYLTFWVYFVTDPTISFARLAGDDFHNGILVNSDGTLQLQYKNSGGTFTNIGSPVAAPSKNVWHRIDLSMLNIMTAGSLAMELKIDGTSVASASGLTTQHSSFPPLSTIYAGCRFVGGGPEGTHDWYIDDMIVRDDQFQPDDGGVVLMKPNANGNYTAWTGTFADVDEVPPDGTTTIITSATAGQAETVGLRSCTESGVAGTISAIRNFAQVGVSTGTSTINPKIRLRSGSTDVDTVPIAGSQPGTLPNSGFAFMQIHTTDPNTSAAWTTAGLDAVEAGIVVDSQTGTRTLQCTSIGVMVWCSDPTTPPPIVSSISPSSGPKAGGTAVTITGEGFTGATAARIGGVDLTSFSVDSDTSITGTTAAKSKAGTYSVEVVGTVIGTLLDGFTYLPGNPNGNGGNNAGGGTTVTVSTPTSPAPTDGDIMYAFITARGTTTTVTQASWGAEIHSRAGTDCVYRVFRKIASSEPGSYVFTLGTSVKASGVIISVPADVDIASQQIASQANASSTNIDAPTLTPGKLGSVSLFSGGIARGTTITPPTNYTEPAGADSASTGGGAATRTTTEAAYRVLTSAAATGTITGVAAAGDTNAGIHIMLDTPKVVDMGLIQNLGKIFSPTLDQVAVTNPSPPLISNLSVTSAPSIAQSVHMGLVDQSAVLFDPELKVNITAQLISQLGSIFEPTVQPLINAQLISNLGVLFNPNFIQEQLLTLGLISQLGVTFEPETKVNITAQLISQLGAVFDPTVIPDQFITPGLISNAGVTFAPELDLAISLELISQFGAVFSPSVLPEQFVDPALINQLGTVFDPQINLSLQLGLISQLGATFNPNLIIEQFVTPDLLTQLGVVFNPSLGTSVFPDLITQLGAPLPPVVIVSQLIDGELITQLGVTFSPEVDLALSLGQISQLGIMFDPTVHQQVQIPLIASLLSVFEPLLAQQGGPTLIGPGLISQLGATFDPTVIEAKLVELGLISQAGQVFSPELDLAIQLGLIPSTIQLFEPWVNMPVELGLISQLGLVSSPAISIGSTQVVEAGLIPPNTQLFDFITHRGILLGLIDNTGQVFPFTLRFPGSMYWINRQSGFIGVKTGGWPSTQSGLAGTKKSEGD